ncbi:MAG: EAL and GGDEF domain-containing protein [Acidihalobacter sp.]
MAPKSTCATVRELLVARRLSVLFQPIVDMPAGEVFGYEALIRGPSDSPLHSPLSLFDSATECGMLCDLDHLCRRLAIERFVALDLPGLLFINVTPETIVQADRPRGETLRVLQELGLSPERVVIELTEHTPIHDYGVMYEAVEHYRAMGFAIALDDLGSGYGGLRHWTELRPEYVKIDGHFAQGIHEDAVKRSFISSMRDISRDLGSRLVVEGIESREEFEVISSLGMDLGQGYFLQRPSAHPPRELPELSTVRRGRVQRLENTAQSLLRTHEPVPSDMLLSEVIERLQDTPQERSVPVVDDGRPVGMVWRHLLMDFYARRYVRELYARKPVSEIMGRQPLTVCLDTPLERNSQLVTSQLEADWDNDFIIVDADGRYLGVGTVIDLLRRVTELQVRYARYANPLTQLPGNVPIGERIDAMLETGEPFVVAYCDLDSFKPFNDLYGYARGDHVLRELGRLLSEAVDRQLDFVGHVGGDDFVLVLVSGSWEATLKALLERFAALVPAFYDEPQRRAGGIASEDRRGLPCFFELLSLSIGVVRVQPGQFRSHHEVAARASEVKRVAKQRNGNTLFVDRREADEGAGTEVERAYAGGQ